LQKSGAQLPYIRRSAGRPTTPSHDRFAAINLAQKLTTFDKHWSPHTVALFKTSDVMVAKIKGGVSLAQARRH
jgi:hypothetical protein